MNIKWREEVRDIKELRPYEKNPRRISKKQYDILEKSINETGYNNRILIDVDNIIIGGHQRWEALKRLKVKEINVLVPERKLTEREFKRILIQDNVAFGEFDFDILANDFTTEELVGWGMNEAWFDTEDETIALNDSDTAINEEKRCEACNQVIKEK